MLSERALAGYKYFLFNLKSTLYDPFEKGQQRASTSIEITFSSILLFLHNKTLSKGRYVCS